MGLKATDSRGKMLRKSTTIFLPSFLSVIIKTVLDAEGLLETTQAFVPLALSWLLLLLSLLSLLWLLLPMLLLLLMLL